MSEQVVASGSYKSKADFIRSAIRTQLESLGLKVKPIIRRYYK
jgi:Arc/MetJ-type ribon-helix-helix transcriptional regulator